MEKNLQVGKVFEGDVLTVAFGGEGILRHENFVIFVPDVIPGEKVRVRITDVRKAFAKGELLEVLAPSTDRVKPECPLFGRCGGCQYQHIGYERQAALKETQVRETLERLGGVKAPGVVAPIIPSERPYGYRNSLRLRVIQGRNGFSLGFAERDGQTLIEVPHCPLALNIVDKAISKTAHELVEEDMPQRIEEVTLKESDGRVHRFLHYRQPYQFETDKRAMFKLGKLEFLHGLDSFFQANSFLVPKLIDAVRSLLAPGRGETLFDLYAGVGLFALSLAKDYSLVVGLELDKEAYECFRINASRASLENVRPLCGRVEARLEMTYQKYKGKKNVAVIDPPREGLAKGLPERLGRLGFEKIAYVSCEPSTLARDIKAMAGSYRLMRVQPIDMFPETKHIETIALLERIGSGE